jgi:hypothetical protein
MLRGSDNVHPEKHRRNGDSVILLILELRRCQNRSHPAKLDRSDSARIGAVEITLVYR